MDELTRFEALGRHVAEEQDREARGFMPSPSEGALLARAWTARRGRAGRIRWAALAVAAAVASFAALWALRPPPQAEALRFSFGQDAHPGQVGVLLATRAEESLPARFSDGSRFLLGPRTRARVQALRSNGADLVIEGGAVRSEVVPGKAHLWRLSVGPFTVLVTGTRFDTSWSPEADQFELSLYQGKVSVSGCGIDRQIELHAGETVQASCQPLHYEVRGNAGEAEATWPKAIATAKGVIAESVPSATSAPREAPSAETVLADVDAVRPGPGASSRQATHAERVSGAVQPEPDKEASGWRGLIRASRYGDAVAAATALGFEHECNTASAADLKALGDAAYFSSDSLKAELAYGTLRRRFAGTSQAAIAAYSLGRLEFDMRGNYGGAARWFQTYLSESPGGALSREALGRLMEAEQRSGDRGAALETARRYLASYPEGPHAQLAHRLAETP